MAEKLLEVMDFSVSFRTYVGEVQAVRGVSFSVDAREIVAIVGESGSGKSVLTQSLVKLLPPPAFIKSGAVRYGGVDLTKLSFTQLRRIKGSEIAYVFQDPMTSLNPTIKVGRQVIEGIRAHARVSREEARARAVALLKNAGIPEPEKRMEQYPHELSGGMRQRVMIAIAIAMNPRLMIADEPTTALDVTIQSQILGTLKALNRERDMALILITHDMGIVASMANRVIVMYGGRIVESGSVFEIFESARHPYTRALLAAVPRLDKDADRPLEYIVGSPPDMIDPPAGCPFAPRCRYSMRVCHEEMPPSARFSDTHMAHCFLSEACAAAQRAQFERDYAAQETEACP